MLAPVPVSHAKAALAPHVADVHLNVLALTNTKFHAMQTPEEAFIARAHPHSWLLNADLLHDQATFLWEKGPRDMLSFHDHHIKIKWTKFTKNQAVFLLTGFVLENAVKAFLVYEYPNWIAGGRLHKKLQSHKISRLSQYSNLIPYKQKYHNFLQIFEGGLESWARYPCGLSVNDMRQERIMNDNIWKRYRFITRWYGRNLEKLLKKGWTDPLNHKSYMEFTERRHLN